MLKKLSLMAVCSAFRFLGGGEPPLLLLSLLHELPAKILNVQKQKSNGALKKFSSSADGVERWCRFSSGSKWEKSPRRTAVRTRPCLK